MRSLGILRRLFLRFDQTIVGTELLWRNSVFFFKQPDEVTVVAEAGLGCDLCNGECWHIQKKMLRKAKTRSVDQRSGSEPVGLLYDAAQMAVADMQCLGNTIGGNILGKVIFDVGLYMT